MIRTSHSTVLKRHRCPVTIGLGLPFSKRKLEEMLDLANLSRAALSSQTGFGGVIGESSPMHRLYKLIGKISPLMHTLLESELFGYAFRGFIVLIHLTDAKFASMTVCCPIGGYANAMFLDL
jgi:hypothetical protein